MPERTGRGEPLFISPDELAEIKRITARILEGMDCVNVRAFENHTIAVLTSEILAARLAAEGELVHKWEFGDHPISSCAPDWCGRYRGQRRDTVTLSAAGLFQMHEQPPPSPSLGPTAYCGACARSGVGACDDFPNCPGGRHAAE